MDSIYETRPWLRNYPEWAPHNLEITHDTALGDFQQSATLNPDATAAYYFDHAISYKEIDRLSDNLAAAFENFGLGKGDRVVVDLQNVPQFLIATYTAWKTGSIVVPMNQGSRSLFFDLCG
ncbi:MAG: AMP-binding protein [Pseudomonadota bacterium]